ncbi:uncharacterized protein Bfra_008582 [Botrytis fragariae]|uniref:Uncharacterized protein n=1 Tax=Botrytis fragariae TaxID=1964551 RepID=A0A8H6EIC6_9HELO|nr:uncharacterized protein Bfra_008582 [Botrytis fragariae]KAF5873301.1 hypothetical protein Bfra_008582 [Botrytis fragariae]
MKRNSSGLREQNEATKGERQRDEPRGSELKYLEKPKYTSARDLGPILRQPKPGWDRYTLAKIPQRMEFELSGENEADHQPGANEYSAIGRNTPLQQRSPKPKATSTLTPPKKHNNHGISRKPLSREPAKKSDFTLLNQFEYGNVLATGANPSSQPPPKAIIPSQSRRQHKISDIQKKSSSHHGAHGDVARDFNDNRKMTRGQNRGIIIPKTRENPALPPRNVHKEDKSFTSQQYPRLSKQRVVAREHRRPITPDLQESRQVPDSVPRSHTYQRNGSQPPVNYSYPSRGARS